MVRKIIMKRYESVFKPNYDKCNKPQKEIYWGVCKHLKKSRIMICQIDKKPCVAWQGYKHGME